MIWYACPEHYGMNKKMRQGKRIEMCILTG